MLRLIAWLGLAGVIVVGTSMGRSKLETPAPVTQQGTSSRMPRARPPVTPVIHIDGDVVGVAAGESGTLTVHVDGKIVRQVAAAADGFVVDVPASSSGMVTLEYAQPGIHFVSPLGSYAQLVRMAGRDRRLTRDECECTRISAFSTALQHVADMMLGHTPRNDAEFRRATRQVGADLANATAVLARLAADPSQLPPTHGTGLALLRDRPAFVDYLYGTYFALLDDPATALDALPTAAMSDADLPERFALLGPLLDVRRPTSTTAHVLEREGSAFRMHAPSGSLGVSHVGSVDDNALVVVPDGDITFVNSTPYCPTTGARTERRSKTTRHVLQRQWSSEGVEIWRLVGESQVTFPDCPDLEGYTDRWVAFQPAFVLGSSRAQTSALHFIGGRALPVFCSTAGEHNGVPLGDCGYAVHNFSRDRSGEIVDMGNKVDDHLQPIQAHGRMPFSWRMGSDGAMHVQAGDERTRYWVLDAGDRAALGVVHVADADRETGHASLAGYSPMIRVGVTDSYNADSVPGAWGYATFDRVTTPHIDTEPSEVRVLRDASGRSWYWEAGYFTSAERWTTAWGWLYSTRYSNSNCVAPSEVCRPQLVRYFRPLAQVGDRIHGIEEMYYYGGTDMSGNVRPPTVVRRPQFHERREMPEGMPGDSVMTPHGNDPVAPASSPKPRPSSASRARTVPAK